MKKAGLLLLGLLVISGCSFFGGPTKEQQVMRDMQSKLWGRDMKSGNIAGTVTFDVTQGTEKMNLTASVNTDFDIATKDSEKAHVTVEFSGNGKAPTGEDLSGKINLELSYVAKMLYLKLSEFAITPEPAELAPMLDMVKSFKGQWYVIDTGILTGTPGAAEAKTESNVSKDQEAKIKELLGKSDIFKVTKAYANETLNGVETYHYAITIDNANMVKFAKEVSTIMNEKFTSDDEKQMLDGLNKIVLGGDLWIGVKDSYVYKGDLTLTIDNKDQASKGTIGAKFTIDPNKAISVTAPTDAKDLITEINKLSAPTTTTEEYNLNGNLEIPGDLNVNGTYDLNSLPSDTEPLLDTNSVQ